ncbi:MAG: family 78 glycoside hydrolase catalytic domain [Planctomycetota bacterium]|nr:family 78 glycoside hydrolase catalytic domain [Planctomycetota bacterium]
MRCELFDGEAAWIWSDEANRICNNFVCFRRTIETDGGAESANLLITADSRYEVYLNGEWLGHGPPRSWPSPWCVDEYDLKGLLKPGRNVIAVLVQHFGIGTFQYITADAGLLAQLDWTDRNGTHRIFTDESWRCVPHEGYAWPVPEISLQQGWEEQFDARCQPAGDGDWREVAFDDRAWPEASVVRPAGSPPHERFELRDIPMLTRQVIEPACVLAVEAVRPAEYTWSMSPKRMLNATDRSANMMFGRMLMVCYLHSDRAQDVRFQSIEFWSGNRWKLNGEPLQLEKYHYQHTNINDACVVMRLRKGCNVLMCRLSEAAHILYVAFNLWTKHPVRFSACPEGSEADESWLAMGPFEISDEEKRSHILHEPCLAAENICPEATAERYCAIWDRGRPDAEDLSAAFTRPMPKELISPVDVACKCFSERTVEGEPVRVENPTAMQHDNAEWTTIHPVRGTDVRLLLDFGNEVVGFHEFEIDAPAGTVLDVHNFEFIQRDGRINMAEGMNNSFRYVASSGRQRYRTFVRRGFRYSRLSLRNFTKPVRIRFVRVLMSTFPQTGRGAFACSDPQLERIWQVGAHTLRCCSEDTYTDCPTYEQVHWVGDARGEALLDLVVNGDPRLSRHCWFQAARSLDRSLLVESHVPSAWQNVIPAWSLLWMRWAQEHYMLTGEKAVARRMLKFLDHSAGSIERHINAEGLFEIEAWNFIDWAPMDTPNEGVVTHQNCLAVLALRQSADLAKRLGQASRARRWASLADRISRAINRHLWSERKRAYVDSIHADGSPSEVFSQQTQAIAHISGVAKGLRAERCGKIVLKPPSGFVRVGSPFFMSFVLEGLVRGGRYAELVSLIRDYWGQQVDAGATTFWEQYHDAPRKTRSHCHGWSAAPTFFLTQHVLGVQPLEPGYAKLLVAPQTGDLAWAQGRVPTPAGDVECQWTNEKDLFTLKVKLPKGLPMRIELPVSGRCRVEKGRARKIASPRGAIRMTSSSDVLELSVRKRRR